MLAKMTVKNQLTLPKAIVAQFKGVEYFDVTLEGESLRLRPMKMSRADEARAKLEALGITEEDVGNAIAWARTFETGEEL
jgi:hypothetical protein